MITYKDFNLRLERGPDDALQVKASCVKGEAAAVLELPEDAGAIAAQLRDFAQATRGVSAGTREAHYEGANPTSASALATGLFNALFRDSVLMRFFELFGTVADDEGVRIKLSFDLNDPQQRELAAIPWEFMVRADTTKPLSLSNQTPIVRYIDAPASTEVAPLNGPLRVLVVMANPKGPHALDLDKERANIDTTWAGDESVEVTYLERPTPQSLQETIAANDFHVLHYMGHGAHDDRSGCGALIFETDDGQPAPYDAEQLGMILGDAKSLRLVFLNACDTARSNDAGSQEPFGGVAAQLVQSGVGAVLAMQFPITDDAAIAFSRCFYSNLAAGAPVDAATAESRKAIRNANAQSLEWGTPVLFMRTADGRLFDRGQDGAAPAAPAQNDTPGPPPAKAVRVLAIAGAVAAVAVGLAAWLGGVFSTVEFAFEQSRYQARVGQNVDLRFAVDGAAQSLETMELYTVTFENYSPELIELDPRCLRDCIIDAAWQVSATALAPGEATVTAKVLNVGPTDDVPVQFSVKVAVEK